MKHPIYLSTKEVSDLEFEIVPQDLRVYLTRLIERDDAFREFGIVNQNFVVNRSRTLAGLPVYVLDGEEYEPSEYAWHNGEFELALRQSSTVQFIELLCEIVERGWLPLAEVNEALSKENTSFRLHFNQQVVRVEVLTLEHVINYNPCLLYTSPSPRDATLSRMPSSA